MPAHSVISEGSYYVTCMEAAVQYIALYLPAKVVSEVAVITDPSLAISVLKYKDEKSLIGLSILL